MPPQRDKILLFCGGESIFVASMQTDRITASIALFTITFIHNHPAPTDFLTF